VRSFWVWLNPVVSKSSSMRLLICRAWSNTSACRLAFSFHPNECVLFSSSPATRVRRSIAVLQTDSLKSWDCLYSTFRFFYFFLIFWFSQPASLPLLFSLVTRLPEVDLGYTYLQTQSQTAPKSDYCIILASGRGSITTHEAACDMRGIPDFTSPVMYALDVCRPWA